VDQPGRADEAVAHREEHRRQRREGIGGGRLFEPHHVEAQHEALRERRHQRAGEEQPVPQRLVMVARLGAELEGDAAQDEAHQHHEDRQVERREDHPVRLREGHEQEAHGEHQPGLVGVPERADRADHAILFRPLRQREEDADAKVEAVEDHVDQDRQPHERGEGPGQPVGGIGEIGQHRLTPRG
jgi:hypothetical protein